jgi:serine/threonine protein phosphatase 1
MYHQHQTINLHNHQRTFFVGDLHGRKDLLDDELARIDFRPENGDVLISVGDLIDYNSGSMELLKLFRTPGFHAVLGNHECFMLDTITLLENEDIYSITNFIRDIEDVPTTLKEQMKDKEKIAQWPKALNRHALSWLINGGRWFFEADNASVLAERRAWVKSNILNRLPYTLTVNFPHFSIGVVHAQPVDNNWKATVTTLMDGEHDSLWSRQQYKFDHTLGFHSTRTEGIDIVVMGHTPVKSRTPFLSGNRCYLDMGTKSGHLPCVISASSLHERLT